jgi:membrane protein DedA with SNARE-associated domain
MTQLLRLWFERILEWGYAGVFFMMALESTIVPIPSEVIIPPAAYWAAQGHLSFWGVVLAGALGSTFGSSLTYGVARAVGRPALERWGRYVLLGPDKLALADGWIADYAVGGVFFARLLPILRHLIGFPAGLARMPFGPFLAATFVGSFLWCTVLAWVGVNTIGQHPELMSDPDALVHVLKEHTLWFVGLALIVGGGYIAVKTYAKRAKVPIVTP